MNKRLYNAQSKSQSDNELLLPVGEKARMRGWTHQEKGPKTVRGKWLFTQGKTINEDKGERFFSPTGF